MLPVIFVRKRCLHMNKNMLLPPELEFEIRRLVLVNRKQQCLQELRNVVEVADPRLLKGCVFIKQKERWRRPNRIQEDFALVLWGKNPTDGLSGANVLCTSLPRIHYIYKNCLSSYWPSSVFTYNVPIRSLAFTPECCKWSGSCERTQE